MSTILQLVGVIAVTIGVTLIYPPAGIIVGGILIGLIGFALGK